MPARLALIREEYQRRRRSIERWQLADGLQLDSHLLWGKQVLRMPTSRINTSPPTLRLIAGAGAPVAKEEEVPISVSVAPPLHRRPGEHLELITVDAPELAGIRRAALAHRLYSDTALALVLERAVVCEQLRDLGREHLIALLDEAARSTGAHVALWDPHSDYLRHLLGHLPAAASGRPVDSPRVAVPVRLHERLARRLPALDDEPEPALRDALAWEVAALLSGETICEWAYRSALAA